MGSKYEIRLSSGVSYYTNSWWDFIKFRIKNRKGILYIRIDYF